MSEQNGWRLNRQAETVRPDLAPGSGAGSGVRALSWPYGEAGFGSHRYALVDRPVDRPRSQNGRRPLHYPCPECPATQGLATPGSGVAAEYAAEPGGGWGLPGGGFALPVQLRAAGLLRAEPQFAQRSRTPAGGIGKNGRYLRAPLEGGPGNTSGHPRTQFASRALPD